VPGYLARFAGRSRLARCSICTGVDLLSLGFNHHYPDCPKAPCQFCQNLVEPGERRIVFNGRNAHESCAVDFEHDRDKESHA
jgi:hypothetical protein